MAPAREVVAVRETAWQHDHIRSLEVVVFVPEHHRLLVQLVNDREPSVLVAVRPRKLDDADLHVDSTDAIEKSSVTGLASSLWHIAVTDAEAAAADSAVVSMTIWRPTCTSAT